MKKLFLFVLLTASAFFGNVKAQTVTDTITYPLDNLSGGGTLFTLHQYVTEIGQYFTVNGNAQVTGVIVYFGAKKQLSSSDIYNVRVYNTGNDSLPTTTLATTTFTTSAVDTLNQINTFTFGTPASVTNRFVVAIEYAATTKNDTNWVFSNNQGDGLGLRRSLVKMNATYGGNWDQAADAFYAPGTTVDLDVDFIILPIYTQAQNPYAQFVASATNVTVGQTVTFTNQSTGTPTPSYSWAFNPNTISYVNATNSTSVNPQVQFLATGTYSVTLTATNSNGSDQEIKLSYINVSSGGGGTPGSCDTLYNFGLTDTLRLYTVTGNAGYVFGHNNYGDISKAEFFDNPFPSATINRAFFYFAVAKAANSSKTINIRVWDNTGLDGNGISGAPGNVLRSQAVTIVSLPTGGSFYTATFTPPVQVTTDFFVGINYAYATGDTVALYSNLNGETVPGTSWEQWSPNANPPSAWYSVFDSWGIDNSLFILADLCGACPAINLNVNSSNNTSCVTPNGSITITATGGTAPYNYNNGFTSNTNGQFTGLTGGTYNITVTDANGCTATTSRTVNNTTGVSLSVGSIVANTACSAPFNGSFTATISGGTGPYNYSISNGIAGSTPVAGSLPVNGLAPGNYTGTVVDANGCSATGSVTIPNNAPTVTLTQQSVTPNTSCNTPNGALTVVASGGTAPYTYSIPGQNNQSGTFSGLAGGNYTITATATNGCAATLTVNIANNTPLITATATNIQPNTNCGTPNGAVTINVTGGTGPYQFTSGSQTITLSPNPYTAANLPGGTYNGTVTDANGCTTTLNFSIANNAPTVNLTQQSVMPNTACGAPNGTFTVVASGGTGPYTYAIPGPIFNQSGIFSGLGGGSYMVTVTDANSCSGTLPVNVANNAVTLNVQVTNNTPNTSCTNPNGSITLSATGGSAPYTYNNGVSTNSTGTFSNLSSGTYNVTVTDLNGCTGNVAVTVANNTPSLNVTQQSLSPNTSCSTPNGSFTVVATGGTSPYTYNNGVVANQTGSFTQLPAGTYSVTATSANGCTGTVQIVVTDNTPTLNIQITGNTPNTSCNTPNGAVSILANGGTPAYSYSGAGFVNTTGNFTGLAGGNYTFTAADASGCTGTVNITVISNAPVLNVTVSSSNNNTSCGTPNGAITVSATGGTPAYSYSIGTSTNTTGVFSGLAGGNYIITATDGAGCSGTVSVSLTNAQANISLITSSIPASSQTAADGSAAVVANGGTAPYTYSWDNGATTSSISNVTVGTYTVTVTDANGCSAIASETIGFTVSINNQLASVKFSVFPNPAKATVNVVVELSEAMPVLMEVYNVLGEKIIAKELGKITTAHNAIEMSEHASGVYLVKISYGNYSIVKRIMLEK
jgi:PKD repeat protein